MTGLWRMVSVFVVCSINILSAAEWHYVSEGQSGQGETCSFYDSDSVKVNNKIIRVWVKQTLVEDFHVFFDGHKEYSAICEKKISDGKIPWAWTMMTNKPKSPVDKYNGVFIIVAMELAANTGNLASVSTILYEIDYDSMKYKVLSANLKTKTGEYIDSGDIVDPQAQFIPPDTEIDMLTKYLYWIHIKYGHSLDIK